MAGPTPAAAAEVPSEGDTIESGRGRGIGIEGEREGAGGTGALPRRLHVGVHHLEY